MRPLLAALAALIALLLPRAVHACEGSVPVVAAITTMHRAEGGVSWDTRWVVDVDAAFDFHGGLLRLAVPLPSGEIMHPARGLTPVLENGRITGVCVEPIAFDGRTLRALFAQPLALATERPVPLGAPLAAGMAVQLIDAHAGDDVRVEASRGGALEPHVGFLAARGIGYDAREEARRLTDAPPLVGRTAIYVRGDDLRAAGGLEGKIGSRAKTRGNAIGVGVVFSGVVLALALVARRLKRAATVERADALLAAEIEAKSG